MQLLTNIVRTEFRDFVDDAHGAFTELFDDLIMSYGLTYHITSVWQPPSKDDEVPACLAEVSLAGRLKMATARRTARGPFCPPDRPSGRAGDIPPSPSFASIL